MDWTLYACDLSGNKLANLSRLGRKRQLQYRLNRPAQLSFEMNADEPGALELQGGLVIKGWRHEASSNPIRFAGYVWQLSDLGEADTFTTKVVCFDPLQRLARRLCRDSGNNVPASGIVSFSAVQVELICRNLLDRTNTGGGVCGLRTNASGPSLGTRTIDFEWRMVADAYAELFDGSGLNAYVEPQDTTDGYLGYLVLQGAISNVAANKLVWGGPTHNAARVERLEDMGGLANDLRLIGSPAAGSDLRPITARTDAGSITAYGRYEDVMTYGDITKQAYLDSLGDQAIALRKAPRNLVKFTPQPDPGSPNALNPFTDFKLGYLVDVAAGAALRGGLTGQQRIWGFDIDLDDDAVERVAAIYTGPDA